MRESSRPSSVSAAPLLSARLDFAARGRRHGRRSEESRLLNAYYRGLCACSSPTPTSRSRSGSGTATATATATAPAPPVVVPTEVIVLTGEVGCGKTALAEYLAGHVSDDGGTCLRGKFDRCRRRRGDDGGGRQRRRPGGGGGGGGERDTCGDGGSSAAAIAGPPFAALAAAFEGFCRNETATEGGRERLRAALGPEGRVLADVVPCLGPTFREKGKGTGKGAGPTATTRRSSSSSLDQNAAAASASVTSCGGAPSNSGELRSRSRRLRRAFRRLVGAVSRVEDDVDPDAVLLLLDDVQWADTSTLELLCSLACEAGGSPFFLVLTLRDDDDQEGGSGSGSGSWQRSELTDALRRLEQSEAVNFSRLRVPPLGRSGTAELVADALQMRTPAIRSLSNLIHDRTGGNVFFAIQYLLSLHEASFLYFDKDNRRWRWNLKGINSTEISSGSNAVLELMIGKIRGLPPFLQQTLEISAFIGVTVIDEIALQAVLRRICSVTGADAHLTAEALEAAFARGLLIKATDSPTDTPSAVAVAPSETEGERPRYRFSHDRIAQAADLMVPENQRAPFHLEIGRALFRNLAATELEERIFLVADQMNCGSALVTDRHERAEIAALNLKAGERAMASSGFPSAAIYLNAGIALLDNEHWRDERYELCLSLHNSAAECAVATGNFDTAQVHIDAVLAHSLSFRDELRAHELLVSSLGSRGKLREAICAGLSVLSRLGEKFPPMSSRTLTAHVAADLIRTRRVLKSCGKGSSAALLRLPRMTDPAKLAAMRVLNHLCYFTYLSKPELAPLIYSRIVQISVRSGVCAVSSTAFAAYGMILGSVLGNMTEMRRFGQLALTLAAKGEARECIPRVHVTVFYLINPWTCHVRDSLEPLREGYRVGMEVGDVDNAFLNAVCLINLSVHGGVPLHRVLSDARKFCDQMAFYKQETHLLNTQLYYQTVMNFMGYSQDPLILTGKEIDQEEMLKDAKENNNDVVIIIVHNMRLILAYHFNDYEVAEKMAVKSRIAQKSLGNHGQVVQAFYDGLTALARAQHGSLRQRGRRLTTALRSLKQMKKFARRCEENCLHKVFFLEAELAALRGHTGDATKLYGRAIEQAGAVGFIHEQAAACERAGIYMFSCGEQFLASEHIKRARLLYCQWGARAKVEQLDRRFPSPHQRKLSICESTARMSWQP